MDYKSRDSKMDMSALKTHNKLRYELPSNLNVVERRSNQVSFADQNSYTNTSGNELVIKINSSTDYVYGKNSYLVFEIQHGTNDGDSKVGFKKGTAMNLFSRVLFEDKSGAELERNTELHRYCRQVGPWHQSSQSVGVHNAMAGQYFSGVPTDTSGNVFLGNGPIANYDCSTPLTICIPLRSFLGVFNRETLIPSTLLSGSMIRLQLEAADVAFENLDGTSTSVTNYTITNPRIVLDSMSLSPVVQKNLLEQSQSGGGLDFVYETVYHQSANPGTSTNFNLQINKAVSRVQKLYWSVRNQSTESKTSKDNLGTSQCNITQLQTRLGNLYFPQQVITVKGGLPVRNGAELYENSLQSINRMKTNADPPSVTKNVFLNSGVLAAADADNNGTCCHVQSFEQSSALEYSGLALNSSRTLETRMNFFDLDDAIQTIDVWISYVKLAKFNQICTILKE